MLQFIVAKVTDNLLRAIRLPINYFVISKYTNTYLFEYILHNLRFPLNNLL